MKILTTAKNLCESGRQIEYMLTTENMAEDQLSNWTELWKLVISMEEDLDHIKHGLNPVAPISYQTVDARLRKARS